MIPPPKSARAMGLGNQPGEPGEVGWGAPLEPGADQQVGAGLAGRGEAFLGEDRLIDRVDDGTPHIFGRSSTAEHRRKIRQAFRPVFLGLRSNRPEVSGEAPALLDELRHLAGGCISVCGQGGQPGPEAQARRPTADDARVKIERLCIVALKERVARTPSRLVAHPDDTEGKPRLIAPGDESRVARAETA